MKILDENYFDLIMNNVLLPLYDIDGSITDADSVTYINERHSVIHLPATDNICALGSCHIIYFQVCMKPPLPSA